MSTRLLMILVSAIAVDLAGFVGSFRQQSDWGIYVLLAATSGLLSAATLGATFRRGSERDTWLGLAVFGWSFLLPALAIALTVGDPWTRAGVILAAQPVALIGGGIARLFGTRGG